MGFADDRSDMEYEQQNYVVLSPRPAVLGQFSSFAFYFECNWVTVDCVDYSAIFYQRRQYRSQSGWYIINSQQFYEVLFVRCLGSITGKPPLVIWISGNPFGKSHCIYVLHVVYLNSEVLHADHRKWTAPFLFRSQTHPPSHYRITLSIPQIHRSIPAVFGHPDPVHLLFVEETIMENCRETSSQPITSGCMILSYQYPHSVECFFGAFDLPNTLFKECQSCTACHMPQQFQFHFSSFV